MRLRFITLVMLVWTICLTVSYLNAGTMTESLVKAVDGKSTLAFIRVAIEPAFNYPQISLKAAQAPFATRKDRYRAGMEALHEIADRTQPPVRQALQQLEITGLARKVKPYWIANVIEAEVAVGSLAALAADPGVASVELFPEPTAIRELPGSMIPPTVGVETNLKVVKADSAWAAGYDGRGRIVCNFDSGVDGLHPALGANYHGNKGFPAGACWFSPTDSSTSPHAFAQSQSYDHGTHTMGIMVGHDDATGDTIGVAPGADWISAVAIDVPGVSILEAFQWAADPDGNSNTISDLPDVINHSWGISGIGCNDILWQVIDNTEALGIVNIFAAGNEGNRGPMTLRNPADRASDSITNFAVGATTHLGDAIWIEGTNGSSRGPSDCDGFSIKPNVVAPGMSIRSSVPNNLYQAYTGTSMAAPHVAGAVAILRQRNPDATVEEIKTALLTSAHDLGVTGPDNTYGWGLIDIMEALRKISPPAAPKIQVSGLDHGQISPGDSLALNLILKNIGAPVDNVVALLSNPATGITVVTPQINFGHFGADSSASGDMPLSLKFDDAMQPGRFYSVDMDLSGSGGFADHQKLNFLVGPKGERSYFNHDVGQAKFSISNFGAFGFYGTSGGDALTGSFIPLNLLGYQLARDTNDLFEAALVIGTDSLHVSDCARNLLAEPDNDFAVVPGGSVTASVPGSIAGQETSSAFNDSIAEHPIGLTITQRSYAWGTAPDDRYIILEYLLKNNTNHSISGVRAGLFLDWDIPPFNINHGSYLPVENIGYLCRHAGTSDSADFRGVCVLSRLGMTGHRVFDNPSEVYGTQLTEAKKYSALVDFSSGTFPIWSDVSHITATGPYDLAPGQTDTVAFAIIGGATWTEFLTAADNARQKYSTFPAAVTDMNNPPLPREFALYQNSPNPFNPTTTIAFYQPRAGMVMAEVFDLLGRKVSLLYEGRLEAGEHAIIWNGRYDSGIIAPSGVYFYRVRIGNQSLSRKMILLK